jgi:hypothetical protein
MEAMMSTLQDILGWQLLPFMYTQEIRKHSLVALSVPGVLYMSCGCNPQA